MQDAKRLAQALGLSSREARFEAELLLMRAAGIDRARLIAHPELATQAASSAAYRAALERRLRGEPVAYILGTREFFGLEFEVTPAVLIPRPDTELLVECALDRLDPAASARVLDVGTGSGCIAISLAHHRPHAQLVATDVSAEALAVARRNATRHGAANVTFRQGAGFEPVAGERFELIVSNPPYIDASDPHLTQGDLRFEPKQALTPGADGTSLLRALVAGAPAVLKPGGWILLEHGHDQAGAVAQALAGAGLVALFSARDLGGRRRASGGRARAG
jgi:release factor glutamine methyltransferase